MKPFAALTLFAMVSCTAEKHVNEHADTAILDDFRTVANDGDFKGLTARIHPEVLKTFRRRLEFTTSSPLEGSWFTGSRDRSPTEEELKSLSDADFFVRFMTGYEPVLGNPFRDAFMGLEIVATTAGTKGYRSFVGTKDTEYAIPATFTFSQVEGQWVLVSPSFIENFSNRLRAAHGQKPEEG